MGSVVLVWVLVWDFVCMFLNLVSFAKHTFLEHLTNNRKQLAEVGLCAPMDNVR